MVSHMQGFLSKAALCYSWRKRQKFPQLVSSMLRQEPVLLLCVSTTWMGTMVMRDIETFHSGTHTSSMNKLQINLIFGVSVHFLTMHIHRHICVWYWPALCMGQIFLTDILEEGDFLSERRKLLRHRAGLTDKDRKKVGFPDSSGKFGSAQSLCIGYLIHELLAMNHALDLVARPDKIRMFMLYVNRLPCVLFSKSFFVSTIRHSRAHVAALPWPKGLAKW